MDNILLIDTVNRHMYIAIITRSYWKFITEIGNMSFDYCVPIIPSEDGINYLFSLIRGNT